MEFNLEHAINEWRKRLRKHKAFEDGDIEELEDHLRSRITEFEQQGQSQKDAFERVMAEDYGDLPQLGQRFEDQRTLQRNYLGLVQNFIKIGFRSIYKHSSYSAVNILGLTIGFACVFGIVIYIQQELSFDRFHENGDDIYRINLHMTRASGQINYPLIPPAVGPELKANFGEIERITRLRYAYSNIVQYEQNSFYEDRIFFAEQDFLEMFSFEIVQGNAQGALNRPNTVLLTESIAKKYFGTESPIGKVLNYANELDLEVAAIIKDPPTNSHFKFDFLVSFQTYKVGPGGLEPLTSWRWLGFLTYLQLKEGTDSEAFAEKATELFTANNNSRTNRTVNVGLQPLFNIYLGSGGLSNPMGGLFRTNDPKSLTSLAVVAALIIVIAFFNYFNILTALMYKRTLEVGMRKVFGSSKLRIISQMLIETCLFVLLSGIFSLLIIWLLSGADYMPELSQAAVVWVVLLMIGLCLAFGLVTGLFTGSSLASYKALSLLQNKLSPRAGKSFFRRVILVIQYGISAALIMVSLIVVDQLDYFTQKDLGYEKDGILVVNFNGENSLQKKEILKNIVRSNPLVKNLTFGPSLDGSASGSPLRPVEWPQEEVIQTSYFGVDYEFIDVLGLEILEGRFFQENMSSDSIEGLLINETLAERLDFDDPLGKRVIFAGDQEFRIIGVFNDFHIRSLHHEIGPMALTLSTSPPRNLLIKYPAEAKERDVISAIQVNWNEAFPEGDLPFQYQVLEDQLGGLYGHEYSFATLIKVFTGLAIFIAVLGMYGFSAVNAHLKIKQICIRRVLGAEIGQISKVVGRDFLLMSLIASLISIPVVYFIMEKWLAGFAYRIEMGPKFFVVAVAIVLAVTIATLALQVRKVMYQKPASILRND